MTAYPPTSDLSRNVALYPWFKLFQSLIFAQAIWFLNFQKTLSAADAILLYVVADLATTFLEVPSGVASDRFGRRMTLILSAGFAGAGAALLALGDSFAVFAAGQVLLGAGAAFASGTDSAFLYESLAAVGREDEIEAQEFKAWRLSFVALALSAAVGGAISLLSYAVPFFLSAISLAVAAGIATQFRDPPRSGRSVVRPDTGVTIATLRVALASPRLVWIICLSVLMYVFSHLPFVFGQPFIHEALLGIGLDQSTPVVSGLVVATMMGLSVIASLYAGGLRDRIGVAAILMLAFAMQIGLSGAIALTDAPIIIAVLLLRMVPDAWSKPFILALVHPLLSNASRATYLSLQSLFGQLLFSATLFWASGTLHQSSDMSYPEIRVILGVYVVCGMLCLIALIVTASHIRFGTRPVQNMTLD